MNKHHTATIGECAIVIPGVLPLEKKQEQPYTYTAIQPGQLTLDGLSGECTTILRDTPCSEEQYLRSGDVLIKRLNPDCAVVFEGSCDRIVASANIFIIRPKRDLDSRYLAFLLEKSKLLQRISQLSGVGTTVAALTVAQVAGGIIPLPPLKRQKTLGEIWALGKRQEKLLRDLLFENDQRMRALCGKLYQ